MVEESALEGKKSAEARSKLEEARAELAETKMRLESETAANAGLKAAVMEANQVCAVAWRGIAWRGVGVGCGRWAGVGWGARP